MEQTNYTNVTPLHSSWLQQGGYGNIISNPQVEFIPESDIPIIDLSDWFLGSEDNRKEVGAKIVRALKDHGFFYVRNHNISPDLIERTMIHGKEFFRRRRMAKESELQQIRARERNNIYPMQMQTGQYPPNFQHQPPPMKTMRGYSDIRQEMLNPYMPPDLKETFDYGLSIDGGEVEMTHLGLNRWPQEGSLAEHGFKDTSVEYLSEAFKLGKNLIHAVCLGLDLPEDTLDALYEKPLVVNRYIRYPPQPQYGYQQYGYGYPSQQYGYGYPPQQYQQQNAFPQQSINQQQQQQYPPQPSMYGYQIPMILNEMGAGSHVDFGAFTLVHQDMAGLEILNQDNGRYVWKLVPPKNGTFVVNSGYILEKLTNGYLPATKHRVINRNLFDRYAIALFLDPNPAMEIEPISKFVNEGNPARFDKCVSGHKGVIFGNKNIYTNIIDTNINK